MMFWRTKCDILLWWILIYYILFICWENGVLQLMVSVIIDSQHHYQIDWYIMLPSSLVVFLNQPWDQKVPPHESLIPHIPPFTGGQGTNILLCDMCRGLPTVFRSHRQTRKMFSSGWEPTSWNVVAFSWKS